MTDIERLPCGVEHELRADAAIIRSWIDVANGPINREALADRLDRYANAAAELTAEIERLRAEVERLNRLLGRIVEGDGDSTLTIRAGTDAFAAAREYLTAPKPTEQENKA